MKTQRPPKALSNQVLASTTTEDKATSEVMFIAHERPGQDKSTSSTTDILLTVPSPSMTAAPASDQRQTTLPPQWSPLSDAIEGLFATCSSEEDLEDLYNRIQTAVEQAADSSLMVHLLLARIDHNSNQLQFFNCGIHSLMLYHNELSEMTSIGSSGIPMSTQLSHHHQKHTLPFGIGDTMYAVWGETCYSIELGPKQEVTLLKSSTTTIPPQMKARYTLAPVGDTGEGKEYVKPQ